MKKTDLKTLAAAAVAVILTGCSSVATFDYASAPGVMAKFEKSEASQKTVAVVPFLDQRQTKYYDPLQAKQASAHPEGDHGSYWFGLIPLIPAGFYEKEEPEKTAEGFVSIGAFQFDPASDLSNAAYTSLQESGLFAGVSKANSAEQADADYIFRGKVTNTFYAGSIYSYCLTYLISPVFWVLGAPFGTSENELWVKFELLNRKGDIVWSHEYRGYDYIMHWIYARHGKDVSLYPQLMKQAMNEALFSLSKNLPALDGKSVVGGEQ